MTTEMALGTLLYSPFSYLMQLLAGEGFIKYCVFTRAVSKELQFKVTLK